MTEQKKKDKKPTQKHRILKYIEDFGSITMLEAFRDLGIGQFHTRMFELEALGYVFESTDERSKNRYGDPVTYKRYKLVKKGMRI